ncbi:MAG: HNH endonuclease [Arenimonas sp.]
MTQKKRDFRGADSYAFERVARDAVKPLLTERGFTDIEDVRKHIGLGQSQIVKATTPNGEFISMRVRLCWRRDGHSRKGHLYSAAQLAAKTIDGNWDATVAHIVKKDVEIGVSHTLFFQRDLNSDVHALLIPSIELPGLWRAQFDMCEAQIKKGATGRSRKNYAANGDSPTIWLQDDRSDGGREVAKLVWGWPGVINLMESSPIESDLRAKYWSVFDAVKALGKPVSVAEVKLWLEGTHPGLDYSDTRENLTLLTVNDANRRHYDKYRKHFRTDMSHPRDLIFRTSEGSSVFYQPYVTAKHGVFDLHTDDEGNWTVLHFPASDVAASIDLSEDTAGNTRESISSIEDARKYIMRAIAARQGQREFRDALIQAYKGKCAVTGCDTISVLEAAHIVPYFGAHTQRTDNGLLLRADIHTLFDLGLLWIDDTMRVRIADVLKNTDYKLFEGSKLTLPVRHIDRPHPNHFDFHRKSKFGNCN